MMKLTVTALLWVAAVGCGVIAGVFFTFSTFVMTALDRSGQAHGVLAMNSINVTIVQSLFMPVFLGTTLVSLALALLSLFRWNEPGALAMLAGGLIYVIGMFVVTMYFNVPLNDALAAVDPASAGDTPVWARYLKEWNLWNHVRTVASLVGTVLFIYALRVR
jgi:uncharacterized membrane protein